MITQQLAILLVLSLRTVAFEGTIEEGIKEEVV